MTVHSCDLITNDQVAAILQTAFKTQPRSLIRQSQTHSGNAIFRADLMDERSVVVRVSPRPATFKYTWHNLIVLGELGLPVQTVLATGPTETGGSFIILNWLRGRDLMYELPQMRPDQMTRVAESIVDFQKRIGTLPASRGFGCAPIGKNAPTSRWTDIFGPAETGPISAGELPLDRLRSRLRGMRQSVEPYFATVRPTCFLDDLTIKNLLVENGELTGIIDVDFVCYGDPLMSVGTTQALLAVDVGGNGLFYGDELVRIWNPAEDGLRAIRFYSALWIVGMLGVAETRGETARVEKMMPIADAMLRFSES